MRVEIDELKRSIDRELKTLEEREARLQQQLEHLSVVEKLAEREPVEEPEKSGLEISDLRQAILQRGHSGSK